MNCWIHLFSICLFDPSNVSVQGDVSWQAAGEAHYFTHDRPYVGAIGQLFATVDVPLSRTLVLRYGIEHRSYLETRDRGEERAMIGFTWRPFHR